MSVDQAVIQSMAERARTLSDQVSANRRRRQRAAVAYGLMEDWEPSSVRRQEPSFGGSRGGVSADPASLERVAEDRAMVRNAETIAARERQEADAAAQAARALPENPGRRLDPNIVQGDRLEELNREQQRLENEKGINISPVQGEDAEAEKPASQKM